MTHAGLLMEQFGALLDAGLGQVSSAAFAVEQNYLILSQRYRCRSEDIPDDVKISIVGRHCTGGHLTLLTPACLVQNLGAHLWWPFSCTECCSAVFLYYRPRVHTYRRLKGGACILNVLLGITLYGVI